MQLANIIPSLRRDIQNGGSNRRFEYREDAAGTKLAISLVAVGIVRTQPLAAMSSRGVSRDKRTT